MNNSNSNEDIKVVWKKFITWFSQKSNLQKLLWIIYFLICIYEFFITRTRYQLFSFMLIATPAIFLVDWLLSKLNKKIIK